MNQNVHWNVQLLWKQNYPPFFKKLNAIFSFIRRSSKMMIFLGIFVSFHYNDNNIYCRDKYFCFSFYKIMHKLRCESIPKELMLWLVLKLLEITISIKYFFLDFLQSSWNMKFNWYRSMWWFMDGSRHINRSTNHLRLYPEN